MAATPISPEERKALEAFTKDLSAAEAPHGARVKRWKQCDDVYNAVMAPNTQEWDSDLHPPYALQIVETLEANIADARTKQTVTAMTPNPRRLDGAKKLTHLIGYQRKRDRFDAKLPQFVRQGLIRGLTVAKVPWVYERAMVNQRMFEAQYDGSVNDQAQAKMATVKNQPSFVVCDVNDFMWDPAATSLEDAGYVFYRTYQTPAQLAYMEQAGLYQNTAGLSGKGSNADEQPGKRNVKNRVEVIERWKRTTTGISLTVVANRQRVLQNEDSPFMHNELPFVACSTIPQLFQIDGKSEVEIIADLQAMMWSLGNQMIDNVRLMNNVVLFINDGVEDPDQIQWYPGAKNFLKDPVNDVKMMHPPVEILQAAQAGISRVMEDMQNITAANAYMSGAGTESIDQRTATGISVIQNMVQKRIIRKKQLFAEALREIGMQQIKLNQQLLPGPVWFMVDNEVGWDTCTPAEITGEYDFDVEDADESINRQERRSEALAKAQFALSVVPLAPGLVNVAAVLGDVYEAFDDDPDKYINAPPPGTAPGGLSAPPMPPGGPTTPLGPPPSPGSAPGAGPPGPILPPAAPPPSQ